MFDNLSRIIDIDINDILPNRFQPRIQFDEEEILELSDSIKEHGVIQPIVVRQVGDKYEIIAGERRYKASVLAGKETIPVIIRNLNDKDSAEIALIENVQRKNLTPIEEALSIKKILDMGYITQENLAVKLGKSQSSIANKIRLLNLTDEVQEALLENKISERHARSLLRIDSSKLQNQMLNRIINERLTVRRTDEEIEKLKNSNNEYESNDSHRIIEKGEMNMNENNMFGINNVPQNPQQNFDVFGAGQQQPVTPSQPVPQSTPSSTTNFDIFGSTNAQPSAPSFDMFKEPVQPSVTKVSQSPEQVPPMGPVPEVNNNGIVMPSIESVPMMQVNPEVQSTPTFNFPNSDVSMPSVSTIPSAVPPVVETNLNINTQVPQSSVEPVVPSFDLPNKDLQTPSFGTPSSTEMPISGNQFDMNNMGSTFKTPQSEVLPSVPVQEASPIPQMSPIMENPQVDNPSQMTQQSENLFTFGNLDTKPTEQQPTSTIPEFKMPEPIIVTDYSKQYDPVMPQTQEQPIPKVDFKEVVNAIRECSSKIEQYGFKIDVEEYDLANLYQVVFKIEK